MDVLNRLRTVRGGECGLKEQHGSGYKLLKMILAAAVSEKLLKVRNWGRR